MLDYIWIDDKSPILNQLPKRFKFAAILLHPFVRMPSGWERTKEKGPGDEGVHLSDEDIYHFGKPVSWLEIRSSSGLISYSELALALKTSIGALRKEYAREDLADKLKSTLSSDIEYPTEDSTPVLMFNSLLNVLSTKGASKFYFSEPLFDKSGLLNIRDTTPLDMCSLSTKELIVTDEDMNYAFMSVYDSFITLFFTTDENIQGIIQSLDCESILCDDQTFISWYLNR